MKLLLFISLFSFSVLASDTDLFHGWSADETWYAFETRTTESTELHLCQTNIPLKPKAKSSWPVEDLTVDELKCVHFLDPNKAPWQWKAKLKLPIPSTRWKKYSVSTELLYGVDDAGFVIELGSEKQICETSGMREDSKIQSVWWNNSGKNVAALIDGKLRHCEVTLVPAKPSGKKK